MPDQSLSRLLLLALPAMLLPALAQASESQPYCCLPLKWYSKMLKSSDRTPTVLPLDVYVTHRSKAPRFEIRSPAGSFMFWRGYMWVFATNASHSLLLDPVPQGYRPSLGLAPLFFRCLAAQNGFERLSATHYRMTEPDTTNAKTRKLGLGSVTDIYVVPDSRQPRSRCHLERFVVTSRALKLHDQVPVIVQDVDTYRATSPAREGFPDRSLAERVRTIRNFYQSLRRSGRIQDNQPHLAVPVKADMP